MPFIISFKNKAFFFVDYLILDRVAIHDLKFNYSNILNKSFLFYLF